MISIWRKATSKTSGVYDICSMAEDTLELAINNDTVEIRFTTGYPKKSNDFIINIGSDSRKKLVDLLLASMTNGKPKNITEYTTDELLSVIKQRMEE